MKEVIAVNLGGTNLRAALVKKNKIVKYIKKKTPKEKKKIIDEMFNSIESLMTKDVNGIGIAFPGPSRKGVVKNTPNLLLKNFDLKKILQEKFKKKIKIENDANCVALAEAEFGCKKENFIILTLGTGIGGGIIINKKLYKGQGYGGEFGHIILDNGKDFEDLWQTNKKLTKKYFGKELLVRDLIKINNRKSKMILNEISVYLGQGIASLADIFDPEIIILSGGIKETKNIFLNMIKKQVKKYLFLPKNPKIKWTKLKHPEILGASLLVK